MNVTYSVACVGENVRHIRTEILHMTQESFAEITNISKDTVSNIERGKSVPTLTNVVSILNAANVSPDFLLQKSEG